MRRSQSTFKLVFAFFLLLAPLTGCATEIIVSAAASLTNAFKEIGQEFEKVHAGVKVTFNFGSSGALLEQISNGAPVDVFAAADQETMDRAERLHLLAAGTRTDFAGNVVVLVMPADARGTVATLGDLVGLTRIAISQPASVPIGRYVMQALTQAKLWDPLLDKFIYTQNVRQTLDYVARGEVDAGFVYATDAAIMKDRVRIALQVPTPTPVLYPIAVIETSKVSALARRFIEFVGSSGEPVLARYGFAPAKVSPPVK